MKRFSLIICLLLLPAAVFSFDTILINQSYLNAQVTLYSDYLNTADEDFSILQVSKPSIARQFSPVHGDILKYNQVSETTWLTFAVNNPTGKPSRMFLTVDTPFLHSIEMFYDIDDGRGYSRVATGTDTAYNQRPYQMGNFVLPIEIQTGYQQIYLKVVPLMASNMKIRLIDENSLLAETRSHVQFMTLITSLLFIALAVCLLSFYRHRMKVALWSTLCVFGFTLNLMGWTGSIAWWAAGIPQVEVAANNLGAFIILFSLARFLPLVRTEAFTSWLGDTLIWVSRFFIALAVLSMLPFTAKLLPVQIILIPVGLTIISIFWFERRPHSLSERLALVGLVAVLLYFTTTTLVLVGLLSAFEPMKIWMSLLILCAAVFVTWSSWIAAKVKGARVAVEGLSIPDVHWPLLRKLNHEIRGPINGVLGMAELLQDTTLSAHQQEYVNTIQTAGFSLLREADQLQNLIRIGLNRLPESEDEFDLYDLIEDTVQPFSRIAHSKHLELVLDIAPEIPTRYRGNAHIIGQILSNLLDNALKYTEHGEVLVQIKPWQNQRIRFSITDTGPGIAKDAKATLYNFPDANNDQQQLPKDVHLGLPISKYLVGLLGGQLSLSSELRMGTTFWVDLPLARASTNSSAQTDAEALKIEELRLMVVDDNLTCRKVIEHLAMSWGAEVLSMSNGQSALANLHNQYHKGEPIDVLILDQNMPSMSGLELAQRIRQDGGLNREIVIIMMTGADDVASDFSDKESGIEFVLSKPVSARALSQTLKLAMPKIVTNRENHHAKKSLFF
jgi:signal transduction histidine kinase/CheY-like chemotaxis protein